MRECCAEIQRAAFSVMLCSIIVLRVQKGIKEFLELDVKATVLLNATA